MSWDRDDRDTLFIADYRVDNDSHPGSDLLNFLSRSSIRGDLLERIASDDDRPPESDLTASDGAISDNTSQLEDNDLIQGGTDGYRLTALGELLVDDFLEFRRKCSDIKQVQLFVRAVPDWETELGSIVEELTRARVEMETITNPRKPVARYKTLVRDSSKIRELVPFRFGIEDDFWRTQTVEGDLNAEFVNSTNPAHITGDLRQLWKDIYDSGRANYWHHGSGLPFAMTILEYADDSDRDDRVCLAVNESKLILVETSSAAVFQWAESTFEKYKERSDRVTPYGLD